MDKNAIKKYAVWARNELIARVTQKAEQYEITEKKITPADAESIGGRVLTATEKKQRQALIVKINQDGFRQVMEEVAYTWFNRFTALRFMEVNNYLPSHTRVFTNESGAFKPQILVDAIQLDLEGLNMDKVFELKDANKTEELYKYLLITQCNALSAILPRMFQKIAHYTELLLPDYLLREGSVIEQMIALIPEEDWTDQVQIIGWLYQFYNSELKADVDAEVKRGGKVSKNTMPAKTQIFTPDWIVKYMVQNSLGRFFAEKTGRFINGLDYYIVTNNTTGENNLLDPTSIKCIDPCMGSGHILCVLFDVLLAVYTNSGYSEKEAATLIIDNNIWGMDIDERAAQLAYFSLMMKARKYDRRLFSKKHNVHVYAIKESNNIDQYDIQYFINNDVAIKKNIKLLLNIMADSKIYGSICDTRSVDFDVLDNRINELNGENSIFATSCLDNLVPLIEASKTLGQIYDIAVTNPPYLANGDMPDKLVERVKDIYPDSKWDMFAVFIERLRSMVKKDGYYALITQPSIVTLASFEKLRRRINSEQSLKSLIHMGRGIFGVDFGSTAFVIKNTLPNHSQTANYFRLHEKTFQYIDPDDIASIFLKALSQKNIRCNYDLYDTKVGVIDEMFSMTNGRKIEYELNPLVFNDVPGAPWIYEANESLLDAFSGSTLKELASPKVGLQTGENNRFTRLWYEVSMERINFNATSLKDALKSGYKWFPYNKGGDYRKWYGNNDYVVNWENNGYEIRNFKNDKGKLKSRPQNVDYYFREAVSWSKISAGSISFRYKPEGFIFDVAGTSFFANGELLYYLAGFCNSSVALKIAKMISPTMNYEVGQIASFPIIVKKEKVNIVSQLVKDCIELSKDDWDAYEISWDFKRHPLVPDINGSKKIHDLYNDWKRICEERFERLKTNETEISRIFESIYSLEGDEAALTEDAISIRKADEKREIKSLISYAVGCMFGRYSLDTYGVAYAGGDWDSTKYKTYIPDLDGIIPICDDEYFADDIVGRFEDFISIVYGKEYLEDNMRYIASVLGGSGTSKQIIRGYFMNEFYSDHCSMCSVSSSGKRPYYWLFDSGKRNGFKCLVYMHRYQSDTIARIRTDYVHEQQSRYRTAIRDLEHRIDGSAASERIKMNKQLTALKAQATEIREYEEKVHHLADQMISIDLDDGVKHNYEIFKDVLAKIK